MAATTTTFPTSRGGATRLLLFPRSTESFEKAVVAQDPSVKHLVAQDPSLRPSQHRKKDSTRGRSTGSFFDEGGGGARLLLLLLSRGGTGSFFKVLVAQEPSSRHS